MNFEEIYEVLSQNINKYIIMMNEKELVEGLLFKGGSIKEMIRVNFIIENCINKKKKLDDKDEEDLLMLFTQLIY